MTTKLISMNVGVRLELEVNGQEKQFSFSAVCPSEQCKQPYDVMFYLKEFLEDKLGINIVQQHVEIAKPKKIKAHRPLSQNQFNKKRQELGYEE